MSFSPLSDVIMKREHMIASNFKQICLGVLILAWGAGTAFAWGERGHDTVARVAARIVAKTDSKLGPLLLKKEYMLGHLANVPDIAWYSMGKAISSENKPTHYLDFEFIWPEKSLPKFSQLPKTYDELLKRIEIQCKDSDKPCAKGDTLEKKAAKTGHAPFRVEQLVAKAIEVGKRVKLLQKQKPLPRKKLNKEGIMFLTYIGVMAHFVGDLGNPNHTSMDYDGKMTGQGGLHSYFESQIVSVLDLKLEDEVEQYILKSKPYQKIREEFKPSTPLEMIYALLFDSFRQLDTLRHLDQKYAILEKSSSGDAKRRPPEAVKEHFRSFVIERIATAADTLAHFWLAIQKESGDPDWSFYRSYTYPLKPQFIPADYAH